MPVENTFLYDLHPEFAEFRDFNSECTFCTFSAKKMYGCGIDKRTELEIPLESDGKSYSTTSIVEYGWSTPNKALPTNPNRKRETHILRILFISNDTHF